MVRRYLIMLLYHVPFQQGIPKLSATHSDEIVESIIIIIMSRGKIAKYYSMDADKFKGYTGNHYITNKFK